MLIIVRLICHKRKEKESKKKLTSRIPIRVDPFSGKQFYKVTVTSVAIFARCSHNRWISPTTSSVGSLCRQ